MKKITRNQAIVLLDTYIKSELPKKKWYKQVQSKISAMVFYGSTAKRKNRANSDLDLLVFLPLKVERKFTRGEYSYQYKKREINVVIRSIERLKILSKLNYNEFENEIFRMSKILWESDNTVRNCIKKIRKKR